MNEPLDVARTLVDAYGRSELNEATTRHQIIDRVLHEVLNWPRICVTCEEYVQPGYADYILKRNGTDSLLCIEAKKEGVYFNLPKSFEPTAKTNFRNVRVDKLLTDESTKVAIEQVRQYCLQQGIGLAAITNGHVWVFFRAFVPNQQWDRQNALVITNLSYFADSFTDATNLLGYRSITDDNSLVNALTGLSRDNRTVYLPKDQIPAFDQTVHSNRLAKTLRPLAVRYFGPIEASESDFMSNCYVSQGALDSSDEGVRDIIKDVITPYLDNAGVLEAGQSDTGGAVAKKLKKTLQQRKQGRVIILFGGKGSGKSTYIRRLLLHEPPEYISKKAIVVVVDLLNIPGSEQQIEEYFWDQLILELDKDEVLTGSRENLMSLFQDRFDIAVQQDLHGLDVSGELFNSTLNSLINSWKSDKQYVAKRLSNYWRKKHRGIILNIDNTDQYSTKIQDYCFVTAQQICSMLGGVTIISMREERYRESKIHGMLDAFQNSGFHIQSPDPKQVFIRRIRYAVKILNKQSKDLELSEHQLENINDSVKLLKVLERHFRNQTSAISNFFNACTHGNIRLALELFVNFIVSGYTNTDEIIGIRNYTISVHQVLKPVMVPSRFFYDENSSDIPNLFKVRSTKNGSHFTSLRLLSKLKEARSSGQGYIPISTLKGDMIDYFNMGDDFELNIDMLLKQGLVESNNRIDYYTPNIDTIKITSYGDYMVNQLVSQFAYLDLVTLDSGFFDEAVANSMVKHGKDDYTSFNKGEKYDRVLLRLEKVKYFLKYLKDQIEEEDSYYSTHSIRLLEKISSGFDKDELRVLRSAHKNRSTQDSKPGNNTSGKKKKNKKNGTRK